MPSFRWPGVSSNIPDEIVRNGGDQPEQLEREPFSLGEHLIDEDRPMKVIIGGMGFSGIAACIRFQQRLKNINVVVYEKNNTIGGTWAENVYPGIACDIPAHCYQFTFEANTQWSSFYAPGQEIHQYLKGVVEKYKLMKYVQLETQITRAEWNEDKGKWIISLKRVKTGEEFTDECDVYIPATGFLNDWKWPDIEGVKSFKGILEHSAGWKSKTEDLKGKKVAVLGNGSSGIQIIPNILPHVEHIDSYIRGPTWIALPFAGEEAVKRNPTGGNFKFSQEELQRFKDDPEYYKQYRLDLEHELNSVHSATLKDSPMQMGARAAFKDMMKTKLAAKPEVADYLIPTFPVACRRLTPGPGYLEALATDKVDVITTHVAKITETGIEDRDGVHREYDVIVCATGFDTSYKPRYPLIGRNGIDLREKWAEYPNAYLAMAVDDFPNMFLISGPNCAVGSGSLLVIFERQVDYILKCVRKMQRERIKTMTVKSEAAEDWSEYVESYFPQTVYSEKCRTWYKAGREEGRVVGLWPGSCLHAVFAMENVRFEDFDYEPLKKQRNRFGWLGNGNTLVETSSTGNRAFYLREDQIDYPPVPKE